MVAMPTQQARGPTRGPGKDPDLAIPLRYEPDGRAGQCRG